MSKINAYYDEIRKYNNLKTILSKIISDLSSSVNEMSNIHSDITSVYSVNDNNTLIVSKVNNLSKDITNTGSYLKNTVLPAIDSAIYSLRKKIEKAKAEEAAEMKNG